MGKVKTKKETQPVLKTKPSSSSKATSSESSSSDGVENQPSVAPQATLLALPFAKDLMTLRPFDASKDEVQVYAASVRDYFTILAATNAMALGALTPAIQVLMVVQKFTGDVASWYHAIPAADRPTTLEELFKQLDAYLHPTPTLEIQIQRFLMASQKASVTQYCTDFNKTIVHLTAYVAEEVMIQKFILGLKPEVASVLQSFPTTGSTLRMVMAQAQRTEMAKGIQRSSRTQEDKENWQPATKRETSRTVKCFFCNKLGHRADDCFRNPKSKNFKGEKGDTWEAARLKYLKQNELLNQEGSVKN